MAAITLYDISRKIVETEHSEFCVRNALADLMLFCEINYIDFEYELNAARPDALHSIQLYEDSQSDDEEE